MNTKGELSASISASILGVQVDFLNVEALHALIEDEIRKKNHSLILNVNVNCLNLAYENNWLRDFLNEARVVFCDGAGVILGARILGYPVSERITYADWTWELAKFAVLSGYTFFFLGAKPGVAYKAAERLKEKYPDLRIEGIHHGYFDKERNSRENQEIIRKINSVRPNILVAAFGMPLQEYWLMENWDQIYANIALTGGAVFDYIAGELRRPPHWMTNRSLEWMGRLVIEPTRLSKRYLLGNPLFIHRILKEKFFRILPS